jgi:hypothetical protein
MSGKKTLSAVFVCFGIAIGGRSASAEVSVTMNGGRVTVTAKNATVGQILAEWAKVGQTKIVNAERVPGGPMTLELKDVPEAEAIEILLRSAGGYVLAPRRAATTNASRYDRILILPQSAPVAPARPQVATVPSPQARPFAPPQARPLPQPGQLAVQTPSADDNSDQDDRPAAAPPAQVARPPVFNTFPQGAPQPRNDPPPPPAPTYTVTAPVGVAVPGMVVPTPQPAGQPAAQQQQPR